MKYMFPGGGRTEEFVVSVAPLVGTGFVAGWGQASSCPKEGDESGT